MKVLLVRPPRIKQAITLGEFMYSEPIGLEIIYAMLEHRHQVEILDLMSDKVKIEDKLKEYKPQVVGITTLCIDVPIVNAITEEVKKYDPAIVTLIGGTQAFLNPQAFFISSVDHVMKYTTTKNITELFYYLENWANVPLIDGIFSRGNNFEATNSQGINEYIHPNRTATAKYRNYYSYFGYRPAAIMATAQGCSKTCRFCLRWKIEGHREKYFPMDFVMEEIRSIKEGTIMVFDNDFLHNADRINTLCDFLESENIKKKFICYASVHSILKNKNMVRRFKSLGLKAVLVGYESFNDEEMQSYQKKSTIEDNFEASKFMKSIGLDVWASFMFHPDWTGADFKAFRRYIQLLSPELSSLSPLTPFPNLPLYKEYKDRVLVKKEDYEKWSFGQVTIIPSNMSLRRYYFEILKTNLYVNIPLKNVAYMVRKFGFLTVFRLFKGSSNLFMRYVKIMIE
ncbi:MAG: radical SAM protein [Desulfitibacter sp. BRH_c19]|nr:MAG: radical SAM protein [Desulfitibacter sp. BRH_c19]